jgi:hypothetical protein
MDLYKTYKLMKQRAKRRHGDVVSHELCKIAQSIFYVAGNEEDILAKIQTIISLETELQFGLKCYGQEMQSAVRSGEYSIDRPYAIRHRFDESNREGLIYVMTSTSRSGQAKLGATTQSMDQRLKSYQSKYQYVVQAEKWKNVAKPFVLENKVAQKLSKYRVTGNTTGDSIEWYHLSSERLWEEVVETLSQRNE